MIAKDSHLPDSINQILGGIIETSISSDVEAIVLTGSYARGDYTTHSDLDIWIFLDRELNHSEKKYELSYHDDVLVSISKGHLTKWKDALENPAEILGLYFAIHDAIVLYEKDGVFSGLQESLREFNWSTIENKKQVQIQEEAIGFIEEVHKVLSGLERADESTVIMGSLGLMLGMSKVMAMHYKLHTSTENEYFGKIQQSAGLESKWTWAFRTLLGLQGQRDYRQMGKAALRLYRETIGIIDLEDSARRPISVAIEKIQSVLE